MIFCFSNVGECRAAKGFIRSLYVHKDYYFLGHFRTAALTKNSTIPKKKYLEKASYRMLCRHKLKKYLP